MSENHTGAFFYANWQASLNNDGSVTALEYPLYSDLSFKGEISGGLGPNQVLNTIGDPVVNPSLPVLVIRSEYHVRWDYQDMSSTDTSTYHGASEAEELTALLALCAGARLKVGDATRVFMPNEDPKGRPFALHYRSQPQPFIPTVATRWVLPRKVTQYEIFLSDRLRHFLRMVPEESMILIRAARLYQDAIWIAESEPALAWLLLVSALEVAAASWQPDYRSPREHLQFVNHKADDRLVSVGGSELAEEIATMLYKYPGLRQRFADFCIAHLPSPPDVRPPENQQVPWDREEIRKLILKVYDYRSRTLHAGEPFPAPMCSHPHRDGDGYSEIPLAGAIGQYGGIWLNKDIPMLLHVFEYITRGCLLNYWDALVSRDK